MEIGDHCLDKSELESRCNQDLSSSYQIVLSRLLAVRNELPPKFFLLNINID